MNQNILWLNELRLADLARVGGKNSSLGEMIGHLAGLGVSVPGGFATTAEAFKAFIAHNDLHQRIFDRLATLDVEDVPALTAAGREIRGWVIDAPLQPDLVDAIRARLREARTARDHLQEEREQTECEKNVEVGRHRRATARAR